MVNEVCKGSGVGHLPVQVTALDWLQICSTLVCVYRLGWNMCVLYSCSKCEVQKCLKIFKSILHILHHISMASFLCGFLVFFVFWLAFFFNIISKTSGAAGGNILS